MSRRIHRRRLINHFQDLPSYINLLHNSVQERNILSSDLLINVTRFFRDREAWNSIENQVLPTLVEQALPHEELRFWVAACSTGEEAYSLAMLIHETIENIDKPLQVKIFATDIDRAALAKASLGVYPQSIANDVSSQRLRKYFLPKGESYQVMRKLREMLIFSPHDLSKDVGFTRMHLITCRNVLIYMRSHLQEQMIRNFHFSLAVKGLLFLGEAEFNTLDKKWKIYQKRRDIKLSLPRKTVPKVSQSFLNRSPKPSVLVSNKKSVHEYSLQRILDKSNSAVLLVSKNNQLLHFYGDSSKILKPPPRKNSH